MKLQLVAFNRGLVDPRALARAADIPRVALSVETFTNWMPRVMGSMMLRPGLGYLGSTRSDNVARFLRFVFSTDDTALIELTASTMRVWVDDSLVTRATVTAAVTNGTFDANITGWTDNSEVGGVPVWVFGGYAGLTGTGTAAAILDQQVTVNETGTKHALTIVIERGPVTLCVGSTVGGDDYITETDLATGTHSLSFTPTGDFHVRLQSRLARQVLVDSCTVEAAGVMTVTAPWAEADLPTIRYDQSGDVLFVACAGYRQRRIERRATESWSVVEYLTDDGPTQVLNVSPTTLTASVLSGNGTLTANNSLFRTTHVGALFRVDSSLQQVSSAIAAENTFTDAIRVTGVGGSRTFTIDITGTWAGTVTLQRSFDSGTGPWADDPGWSWTANVNTTRGDGLDNQIVWYRLGIKTGDYTSGTATCALDYASGSITGYARVTGYTSATVVNIEVLQAFGSTTSERDWYEGSWSDLRGWPTAVALDEGRLWWAGQDRIYGSVSDNFTSFDADTEGDSGPISRSIGRGPVDTINWIVGAKQLLIGAEGSEWEAQSTSFDEPLTPTNFHLHDFSTQGSAGVGAAKVDNRILWVQRGGIRVFESVPSDSGYGYLSSDVSGLVPAIGKPGITVMDAQRQPDTRVLAVRSDGTMAVLVYDSLEEVLCWLEIETDGLIEDVAVLPAKDGEADDQVYAVIRRSLDRETNVWSAANVKDYGGVLGTTVTAAGVTFANFASIVGTNFCSWQGASAAGDTHELRITPTGSVADIRIIGHVTETILVENVALVEGVESVITINVPSTGGETGWRVIGNEASIPAGTWACTLYDISNPDVHRYLEKLALEDDCIGGTTTKLADSFVTFTNETARATISGLDHLEGESVVVWADGKCLDDADGEVATFTVSGGAITATDGGAVYQATTGMVGLPYTAQLKSGKLLQLPSGRSAIGSHKKIGGLGLILAHAHAKGIEFGRDFVHLEQMPEVEDGAIIDPDSVRTAYEGEFVEFPGQWGTDERLCLQAVAPRPVYVLAAAFEVNANK